jgi:hypothetical protein
VGRQRSPPRARRLRSIASGWFTSQKQERRRKAPFLFVSLKRGA